MKKLSLAIFALLLSKSALSQTMENTQVTPLKRLHVGFNIGVNYSNLLVSEKPENALIANKIGGRVGILADYRLNKIISISPKAELAFHNNKIRFEYATEPAYTYRVMPISLEIMNHFVFKDSKKNVSPYFYVGPNVKIPLEKQSSDPTQFRTNTDFAIDFGIGLNKPFKSFRLAPELRYSLGLLNVNASPMIKSAKFHTVSLIFNFTD